MVSQCMESHDVERMEEEQLEKITELSVKSLRTGEQPLIKRTLGG